MPQSQAPFPSSQWSVESLLAFSSQYWQVCALHAAVEAGVFTALADAPLDDAGLAAKAAISPRGARALGCAVCALGLAGREDGRIALTDFARRHLVRSSPDYLGDIIMHHHHLMDGWSRLARAAVTDTPAHRPSEETPEGLAAFQRGMANMATVRAGEVAARLDLSQASRVMDLGGGPGSYAAAFCAANPKLRAVIFDRPATEPFAMATIRERGLEDRISFAAGDILSSELPAGFDAVWISHVIHSAPPADAGVICGKAARACNAGGTVYIQEFFLDDTMDGPLFPALFNLNMLQATRGGQAYTWAEAEGIMARAGLVGIRRLSIGANPGIGILAGDRPARQS